MKFPSYQLIKYSSCVFSAIIVCIEFIVQNHDHLIDLILKNGNQ